MTYQQKHALLGTLILIKEMKKGRSFGQTQRGNNLAALGIYLKGNVNDRQIWKYIRVGFGLVDLCSTSVL